MGGGEGGREGEIGRESGGGEGGKKESKDLRSFFESPCLRGKRKGEEKKEGKGGEKEPQQHYRLERRCLRGKRERQEKKEEKGGGERT